jgi:hypothetical protein
MICPPCLHDLHEFCRECDCDCMTGFHEPDYEPPELEGDEWQIGQDRYEAQMYGRPDQP